MSFLTEVPTALECTDPASVTSVTTAAITTAPTTNGTGVITAPASTYEYHLPHTRAIDLIGEEFAPRLKTGDLGPGAPNVVVVSAVPANFGGGNIIQTTQAGTQFITAEQLSQGVNTVTVDLHSGSNFTTIQQQPQAQPPQVTHDENGGVLLCNLDELSRYIPENFYSSDLNFSDHSSLEATTTTSSIASNTASASAAIMSSATSPQTQTLTSPKPITIQLPTQPQPVTSRPVTFLQTSPNKAMTAPQLTTATLSCQPQVVTSNFQPVKLTTTGFAYTATGERIAIQGLADPTKAAGTTVQVLKAGPQTLQLQGMNLDQKLTLFQELPDVSKIVVQEAKPQAQDSITNILEEMKTEPAAQGLATATPISVATTGAGGVEYATAIPVAVTQLTSPNGNKLPQTIMLPAGTTAAATKKPIHLPSGSVTSSMANLTPTNAPRNIIFAGNTLPQGAIPIQISGLNTLPISAVKSIPMPVNLSTLTPTSAPVLTTATINQVVAAKKTKVDLVSSLPSRVTTSVPTNTTASVVNKVNNNNKTGGHKATGGSFSGKVNSKTCSWVFENGEMCGKTFSKSYNLVVHMRMHEDVRPFQCGMCDQTFRQKAHLQRHETTHGSGSGMSNGSRMVSPGNGLPPPKRRRKSRGSAGRGGATATPVTPVAHNPQLQARLERVSLQFGTKKEDEEIDAAVAELNNQDLSNKRHLTEVIQDPNEAVLAGALPAETTEIIELKDGEAFLAAATDGGKGFKTGEAAEPAKIILNQAGGIELDPGVTAAVKEAMSDMSTMKSAGSGSQSVVTLSAAGGTTKTIVIQNFEDQSPEIQKDILNAILVQDNALAGPEATPVGEPTAEVKEEETSSATPVTVEEFQA